MASCKVVPPVYVFMLGKLAGVVDTLVSFVIRDADEHPSEVGIFIDGRIYTGWNSICRSVKGHIYAEIKDAHAVNNLFFVLHATWDAVDE